MLETNVIYNEDCVSGLALRGGHGQWKLLYGWHISKLEVYDTPRDLSEFMKPCKNDLFCEAYAMYREFEERCGNAALTIKRAPQSWCYVEEGASC